MVPGWAEWYDQIARRFGYDPRRDGAAASLLDSLLPGPADIARLLSIIRGRGVLCAGAGPSLVRSLPALRRRRRMSLIAADSSVPVLLEHGIAPDLVVTDLDGFPLDAAPRDTPLVVHAHGDNMSRLPAVRGLDVCLGTAQTAPTGRVLNFGGFTDGDRAVFLASAMGARDIVLCGMDLEGPVTASSGDPRIKLEKIRIAADLLEWLATFTESKLYTASQPLRGFRSVTCRELRDMGESGTWPDGT